MALDPRKSLTPAPAPHATDTYHTYLPTPHSEVPELPRTKPITQEPSQHRYTTKEAPTENADKEQRGHRPPPPPVGGNNRPLPPSHTPLRPMPKPIQTLKSQKPKTSGQACANPTQLRKRSPCHPTTAGNCPATGFPRGNSTTTTATTQIKIAEALAATDDATTTAA